MSITIHEPARELPVAGSYDVVVAGGGIAGAAAAVAAARNGASVCLLERLFGLGGLATLGNVIVFLPICDGRGRQVMGGLPEEMLRLSVRDLRADRPQAGLRTIPECWREGGDPEERAKHRFRVDFNPAWYMLELEKWVLAAGVDLLYDTRICAVAGDGRIDHVVVENKSGRQAIACRAVVDASGDADLCFLAGEETESLDSNVVCGWFYMLGGDGLRLYPKSKRFSPYCRKEEAEGPFFRGDDARQVTDHVLATREMIRAALAEAREKDPETDVQLIMPPTYPCFRMTRRLVSDFNLGERHMHEWFDDTVGLTGDWRKSGPVYAVPHRTLRAPRTRNLLVAGRCIAADTTVWDVTRAIPTCALTGEAAGTAAALAATDHHGDIAALPVSVLQDRLRRQGVLVDPSLVAPAAGA